MVSLGAGTPHAFAGRLERGQQRQHSGQRPQQPRMLNAKTGGVHKMRIYPHIAKTVRDPLLQEGSSKGGAPQATEATGTGRWDLTAALKAPTLLSLNVCSSYANPCIFLAMKTST